MQIWFEATSRLSRIWGCVEQIILTQFGNRPPEGQLAVAPTGRILSVSGAALRATPRTPANDDIVEPTHAGPRSRSNNRLGYLCAVIAFAGAAAYASSTPLYHEPLSHDPYAAQAAAGSRASLLSQAKEVAAHYSNATFDRSVYEYVPERFGAPQPEQAALQRTVLWAESPKQEASRAESSRLGELGAKRRAGAMTLRVEGIIKYYAPKGGDPKQLAARIVRESEAQGYDPLFVAAVIKSESMFNTMARSHVGARGLMQIMPATGKWLAGKHSIQRLQLHDSEQNLKLGIAYLKELEAGYNGDKVMTLVAYNWGPGHVQMAGMGKRRIPGEVMRYAVKILNDYRRWRGEPQPMRAIG